MEEQQGTELKEGRYGEYRMDPKRPGRYVDDPEARKKVWKEAPKAVDKYGNKLIKIGHYWCGYDFNRFWRLVMDESEENQYIIIARVSDGRFYSKKRTEIRRVKGNWERRISTGWYIFVEPNVQQVYQ